MDSTLKIADLQPDMTISFSTLTRAYRHYYVLAKNEQRAFMDICPTPVPATPISERILFTNTLAGSFVRHDSDV